MLNSEISERLSTTFECFFKHSIKHFVQEPLENEDKIQCIFSLQEALELLLKFYIVEKMGYRSIIEDSQAGKPESELQSLLDQGKLKTIGFGKALSLLKNSGECPIFEDDFDLIKDFQEARNQIAHMGYKTFPNTLLNGIFRLITSVFSDLEYLDHGDGPDLFNALKFKLGNDLYYQFTSNKELREAAEDKADDVTDDVHHCLECEARTVLDDNVPYGYYKCILCGYKIGKQYASIIKCPQCETNNLYFDTLNISPSNDVNGHCPCCGATFTVSQCKECRAYYVSGCSSCSCDFE